MTLVGVSTFGSAFEGGTVTLLAAAVESVVLLTLLLRRGESVSCPAVRSIVCFEYFALLAVSLSGLLARWVWPHACGVKGDSELLNLNQ